jgi:hypothetical protein
MKTAHDCRAARRARGVTEEDDRLAHVLAWHESDTFEERARRPLRQAAEVSGRLARNLYRQWIWRRGHHK